MRVPYTFTVVRYVHDPIAGEALNIGVLLHSAATPFLDVKLEYRYERFSATFAGFDGERFEQVLRHFQGAVGEARDALVTRHPFVPDSGKETTATDIARRIWIDRGTSFRVTEPMGGVGENLRAILDELFHRFVTSQYERPEPELGKVYAQ